MSEEGLDLELLAARALPSPSAFLCLRMHDLKWRHPSVTEPRSGSGGRRARALFGRTKHRITESAWGVVY